jgi:hypothetical protein
VSVKLREPLTGSQIIKVSEEWIVDSMSSMEAAAPQLAAPANAKQAPLAQTPPSAAVEKDQELEDAQFEFYE